MVEVTKQRALLINKWKTSKGTSNNVAKEKKKGTEYQ